MFKGLKNLRKFKITSAFLQNVDKDAFSELPNLNKLDIRGGWNLKVKNLINGGITYPNLEHLNLSGTLYIDLIPKGGLYSMPNLKSITWAETDLRTIESNAFNGADKLLEIDLSDNGLTRLPFGIFSKIARRPGARINLSNNPWICSCDLVELQQLLTDKETKDAFVDVETVQCIKQIYPNRVYGATVKSAELCKGKQSQ